MLSKNINKIFVIIILAILIMFALMNTVKAVNISSVNKGDIIDFYSEGIGGDAFLRNKYLYCLNHGYEFAAYAKHYCYDTGSLDSSPLPYIVEQQEPGKRDQFVDVEANALWTITGESKVELNTVKDKTLAAQVDTLINEANASCNLSEDDTNISLVVLDENGYKTDILENGDSISLNEVLTENSDGTYGRFQLIYPSYFNEVTGSTEVLGDLNIYVNGNKYNSIPPSGRIFGFSIADGIKLGQENTIRITYSAKKYTGSYIKLRPYITRRVEYECQVESETFHYWEIDEVGYFKNGNFIVDNNYDGQQDTPIIPCGLGLCHDAKWRTLNKVIKYTVNPNWVQTSPINLQDLIWIETEEIEINEEIEVEFIAGRPDIEINFNKVDTEGYRIDGAGFNVSVQNGTIKEGSSNIITSSYRSNKIVIEPSRNANTVTVRLSETYAPSGYAILEEDIVITYKWDNTKRMWVNQTSSYRTYNGEYISIIQEMSSRTSGKCVFTVSAENRRNIKIDLFKTDNGSNILPNMIFDIKVSGGTCEKSRITTDSDGEASFMITPNGTGDVTLTLTEDNDKFYMDIEPIVITFTYRGGRWQAIVDSSVRDQVSIDGGSSEFDIEITNIAKVENLRLVKLNKSVLGEVIPGVTFRITLENAKTLTGIQFMTATTDNNGEINLGILEVIDPDKPIVVTLEEVSVPNDGLTYNGLYTTGNTVTITFNHKQAGCKVDNKLVEANYKLTENKVEVEISNIVTMDLAGMVWLDGQTGLKPVKAPNAAKDSSEPGISGVDVKLIRDDGIQINTAKTDNQGNYKFTEVPASIKGNLKYYILFTYNGIDYIATEPGIDSDAIEVNRDKFNDRFATITKDTATGKNGEKISLKYNYNNDDAILETTENGVLKAEFAISATTMPTTYNKNTNNIDLGLMKKGVDLAAVTDIYEAKVSINGEERVYDYNDIMQLEKDENDNPILDSLSEESAKYNLYLYNSDYNYRIGSYKLPAAKKDTLNVYKNNASEDLLNKRKEDGVLNVEATYQILLNNQTATDATINQIAYYYDTKYILKDIITEGVTTVGKPELVTLDGTTYNKIILDVNQEFTNTDNQGEIKIVFTIGKDTNGNVYTGLMKNWVEIISYSTNSGCIDKDSAPDNIETHKTEDDTDDAAGLNVQLNHIEREVTGYVFEDKKSNNPGQYNIGNGQYDNGENQINDVIVQLIEIKNVTVGNTTLRLEYIWQETVSGSDKVTYVTSDGKSKGEYNVTPKQGQYTFNKNIIPGDYIVRFIYGDSTYYDTESAANLFKYNGQDYKSTIDVAYKQAIYSPKSYQQNSSMARDNEARRLEQMAYATGVASNKVGDLKIDNKTELSKTWMCAETSLVEMKVSDAEIEGDGTNAISRGINFGLVERPRAYLTLEKHITGLKIAGVTEGSTTLENYDKAINNGGIVKLLANSGESILAEATNKDQNTRGRWLIQTKTNQIAGKRLDITYSYRVQNKGDIEYIGEALINKLSAGQTYAMIAEEAKAKSLAPNYVPGEYLGTAYYNGQKNKDVVASISFQIEDYLSNTNGLELDTTSDFTVSNPKASKYVWDYNDLKIAEKTKEYVSVMQSKVLSLDATQNKYTNKPLQLSVYDESLDSVGTTEGFNYRSYAAQLIYPSTGMITSQAGTLCKGNITLGNLATVQSYVDDLNSVPVKNIVPEADESIAETVVITMDTGANRETPVVLIISITAGLAIVAVGVVLIKKFIIK